MGPLKARGNAAPKALGCIALGDCAGFGGIGRGKRPYWTAILQDPCTRDSGRTLSVRTATSKRSVLSVKRCSTARQASVSASASASASTLASTTAINPPSTVPPALRDLHSSLVRLQGEASAFVNLSRLKLALHGLETDRPTTRVAILALGENGHRAARRLARVLLSDPLGDEEQWERDLLEMNSDGRGLVLKHDGRGASTPGVGGEQRLPGLVETRHIGAETLRRHGLELLISTLPYNSATISTTPSFEEAILVPMFQTAISTSGRASFFRYPVHEAIVVGEGIDGCVAYGRVAHHLPESNCIKHALSLTSAAETGSATTRELADRALLPIDLDLALHAQKIFRADTANGPRFNEEWQRSGVMDLAQWLGMSSKPSGSTPLTVALGKHIEALVTATNDAIDAALKEQTTEATAASMSESRRTDLQNTIKSWSAFAHKDLQLSLSSAFASASWKRTVWWRLLWRIDDVAYSIADILRRSWLHESEQGLAFISGRIREAGLPMERTVLPIDPVLAAESDFGGTETATQAKKGEPSAADVLQMSSTRAKLRDQSGINHLFSPPWPQTIHLSRLALLNTVAPALHRRAQSLLVTTLSTITGTTALGAWLYAASYSTALYEAGAVAALGLVWSLRRLQRLWTKDRETFEGSVKEEGRRVLGEVEAGLRGTVREGGRVEVRVEDRRSWLEVRRAVLACEEALKKVT